MPPAPPTPAQNISAQVSQSTSSNTGDKGAASYATVTGKVSLSILNLDLRPDFTPYCVPNLEQIIHSVQALFPLDEGLRLQQLRGAATGVYSVLFSKPIDDLTHKVVTFKNSNTQINIQLGAYEPKSQQGDRKEGLLITFLNAAAGTAISIPNATFDAVMKKNGDIIKQ